MSRDELFTDPRNPEFDIPHRFSNKSASSGDCAAVHDPTDIWAFLHDEMRGRVCLNQDSVWKQLRVDGIEVDIVRTCCKELEVACAESIQGLQEIESNVSKRSELQMYPLFLKLFRFIEEFVPSSTPNHTPIRRLIQHANLTFDEETNPYTTEFPRNSPAFHLETIHQDNPNDENGIHFWRIADGFCEVKVDSSNGPPLSENPNGYSEILSQSANYARLHMSARPFLLFSIGLLIYGSRFCVCIFDRAGVRISPELNIWSSLEMFVRVVRSLTCVLGPQGIGQDPTVRLLKQPSKPDSYIIKPIGEDKRHWCTIGTPVWSSLSLFGRGTVVWKVAEYDEEREEIAGWTMIMKTAWRSVQRIPESNISRYVTAIASANPEVSVAEFVAGGDVFVEGGSSPDMRLTTEPSIEHDARDTNGTLITVPYLRREIYSEGASPILHRIITSTIGRPLWEFKDDKELARGLIAVLQSHKKLCELHVLHRDISPGNILLAEISERVRHGQEGFLLDFELARVADEVCDYERVGDNPTTGTLQFMAVDLLDAIINQRHSAPGTRFVFKHEAHHDLESLVWVLGYVQMRKMLSIATSKIEYKRERETLNELFTSVFGRTDVGDILDSREFLKPLGWIEDKSLKDFLAKHLSPKIGFLMAILYGKIHELYFQKRMERGTYISASHSNNNTGTKNPFQTKNARGKEEDLTHDYLIGLFRQLCDDT